MSGFLLQSENSSDFATCFCADGWNRTQATCAANKCFIQYTIASPTRQSFTFFNVLVLVEGLDGVILSQASEGVDEVGAEIGVDVLRRELAAALTVDGPVGEVADDAFVLVHQLPT